MSLGNFRSFKVYKGKNSALLGGMRCSLALSLHMIHINGFGVKKQPPIALLSNICLVVLVKTVPLLAASTYVTLWYLWAVRAAGGFPNQKLWSLNLMMSMWHLWQSILKKSFLKADINYQEWMSGKNSLLWPVFQ